MSSSPREAARQRWLVSYADMVTMLFCLFLVLFGVSSVDNARLKQLATALNARLRESRPQPTYQPQGPMPAQPPAATPVALATSVPAPGPRATPIPVKSVGRDARLQQMLTLALGRGVRFEPSREGIGVALGSDGILFESGRARILPAGRDLLERLVTVAQEGDFWLRIEGHTDNLPIKTPRFTSNWDLSVARACAVARVFLEGGIPPDHLSVMGYGDTRPVADNRTAAGRARNRRVVIVFCK